MIFGIGTDIVRVARMAQSLERFGNRFARKILADSEWTEFQQKSDAQLQAAFLAKRFAAKEAAAKALGTGFSDGLFLHHIFVTHTEAGQPQLEFSGKAQEMYQRFQIGSTHLSIADEAEFAVAYVVLEKSDSGIAEK